MKNSLARILFKPVIGIVLFTSSGILVSGCGAIMKPIFKAGVKALSEGGEELVSRTAKGVAKSSDNAFNNPAGRVVGRKVGQRAFSSSKEVEKENSEISNFNTGWDRESSLVKSKGRLHQAKLARLNKNINTKPDYSLYHLRGELKAEHLNDYSGAILDLDKSIKLKSDYAPAYNARGISRSRLGDYQGALNDYTIAIKIDPEASYFYNRGSLKSKRFRDFDGALSDLNLAIKIYPKYENAYIVRGIVKTSLDDYNGAISDYTKAIDLNADNALAYYNRAAVKAKYLRNRKTACADFEIAASLGHSGAKKVSNNLDCDEFR